MLPRLVVDAWGFCLSDPTDGSIVGRQGVIVSRILSAQWTHDTRRL